MRVAADPEDYRRDPTGSYLVLPRGLVFCARRTLWGFCLWGTPTETDLRRMVPLLELELAPAASPHASLVDVRRLDAGDPRAFLVLSKYLRAHFDAFRRQVTRLALVRPPGVLGATVAGFFEVAGAPYPVRVFGDLAAATAWLRARELAQVIDGAIAHGSGVSPIIMQLRRWLDGHLGDASLARAARAMSRAPRSLQRDLAAAETSFQLELDTARVRLAQRLLRDTESPLTEIAYDVGCASPQHFSTVFRRVVGVAPSRWRQPHSNRRPSGKRA